MRDIKRLAIEHDCAVLIIHHTRKGGDLTNAEARVYRSLQNTGTARPIVTLLS
jgi:RecA-family ATPase